MTTIISVHSFRGGTGKSNLTANLAATLALAEKRVGVIDTDIQSPGIHVLFGLEEGQLPRALNDYLWGRCRIEETAYDVTHRLGQPTAGALFLIPSSIKAGEIARVLREGYDVSLLNDGFQQLGSRLRLDYLVIDTHPGLNEETLLSIAISEVLLLLLRPDRQDFQGTAVTVEVARKLEVPRMLLVINKALPSFDFAQLKRQVEQTYQAPVAGILPLSEEVVRLASSDLFALRFPDDPWSSEVRQIAQQLLA
ncbi:MAG: CDP-3, 6-dideoxy-D-glycero-L-glycero-4-hexulose-4-reductase [Dehalococcoidia bacterium]|nr:MAG: CDP-3, 6-dideoxy-D-glycero-L-glycero-4-hexulose-4-reductase [Dehalococcoidia bacterium]